MNKPVTIRFETKTTPSGITLTMQISDSTRIQTQRFRNSAYVSANARVQAFIQQKVQNAKDTIEQRDLAVYLNGEPWTPPPEKPTASEIKRVIQAVLEGKPNAIDGLKRLYDRL